MEKTKKWNIAVIVTIICLVIALIACVVWCHQLSNDISLLKTEYQRLKHQVYNVSTKLDNLNREFDETVQQMTSLTEKLDYTLLGTGTQPNTAAYEISLTPKELGEDTAVQITVGETTVPFTRNGDVFTATVDIPMFEENIEYPTLTITNAGVSKTDTLEELDLYHAYRYVLPELFSSGHGSGGSEEADKTEVFCSFGLRQDFLHIGAPVNFTKATVTRIVNGEEITNRDVTNELHDAGGFSEYNASISMADSDQAAVIFRAEDALGYIHEIKNTWIYSERTSCIILHKTEERIYSADGTVLYENIQEEPLA
jgi:hypothetical protein